MFQGDSLPMDRRDARFLAVDSYSRRWNVILRVMSAIGSLPGKKAVILISQDWLTADRTWVLSSKWDLPIATPTGDLDDRAIRAGATIYVMRSTPRPSTA